MAHPTLRPSQHMASEVQHEREILEDQSVLAILWAHRHEVDLEAKEKDWVS